MIHLPAGISSSYQLQPLRRTTAVIAADGTEIAYCLHEANAIEIARALNARMQPQIAQELATALQLWHSDHDGQIRMTNGDVAKSAEILKRAVPHATPPRPINPFDPAAPASPPEPVEIAPHVEGSAAP